MNLKDLVVKRKYFFVSAGIHVMVIGSMIMISGVLFKRHQEPVKIHEVELFNPAPPAPEPEAPPQPKEEPIVMPEKPKEVPKPKVKPPEPLESDLKNKIMKEWNSVEKKNLQQDSAVKGDIPIKP